MIKLLALLVGLGVAGFVIDEAVRHKRHPKWSTTVVRIGLLVATLFVVAAYLVRPEIF